MEKSISIIWCPRCGSRKNTNPEKIGEIVQCLDCGNFWIKGEEEEGKKKVEIPKSPIKFLLRKNEKDSANSK